MLIFRYFTILLETHTEAQAELIGAIVVMFVVFATFVQYVWF
jgi:hypothetical protein